MYKLKIDRETVEKYDFKTLKVVGFKTLKELKLPDNYFGGRVDKIAVLKDEENLVIIDEFRNTIGVMFKKTEEDENCTKEEVFKCEDCGKEFNTNNKLSAHKRFCKVKGK